MHIGALPYTWAFGGSSQGPLTLAPSIPQPRLSNMYAYGLGVAYTSPDNQYVFLWMGEGADAPCTWPLIERPGDVAVGGGTAWSAAYGPTFCVAFILRLIPIPIATLSPAKNWCLAHVHLVLHAHGTYAWEGHGWRNVAAGTCTHQITDVSARTCWQGYILTCQTCRCMITTPKA